jgi:hypothetical protein
MFLKIIFNILTTIVIKEKVDNEQKPSVNFKISKPNKKCVTNCMLHGRRLRI